MFFYHFYFYIQKNLLLQKLFLLLLLVYKTIFFHAQKEFQCLYLFFIHLLYFLVFSLKGFLYVAVWHHLFLSLVFVNIKRFLTSLIMFLSMFLSSQSLVELVIFICCENNNFFLNNSLIQFKKRFKIRVTKQY